MCVCENKDVSVRSEKQHEAVKEKLKPHCRLAICSSVAYIIYDSSAE